MTNSERGDNLLNTVARIQRWATRHAALPAPAAQLRLLSLLEHMGPSRIGDLAQADNSSQPTMTTQVQRLERMGFVARSADSRDARATLISMTPEGREVLGRARSARREVVKPLFEGFTEEELVAVDKALDILNRGLAAQALQ